MRWVACMHGAAGCLRCLQPCEAPCLRASQRGSACARSRPSRRSAAAVRRACRAAGAAHRQADGGELPSAVCAASAALADAGVEVLDVLPACSVVRAAPRRVCCAAGPWQRPPAGALRALTMRALSRARARVRVVCRVARPRLRSLLPCCRHSASTGCYWTQCRQRRRSSRARCWWPTPRHSTRCARAWCVCVWGGEVGCSVCWRDGLLGVDGALVLAAFGSGAAVRTACLVLRGTACRSNAPNTPAHR
jgi:hypothetical protein